MKRTVLNTAALAAAALLALVCANCNGKGTAVGDDRWEGDVDRLMEMFNAKHGFPPKDTTPTVVTPPVTPPDTTPTVVTPPVTPPDTTPTIVAPPAKYAVTVNSAGAGASGGGSYEAGAMVAIYAGEPPDGKKFKNWTTESAGVILTDAYNEVTMFAMPENAVTVTAVFEQSAVGAVDPATVVKGAFTDSRDNKTYKTVKIGSQVWMAENLNYDTANGKGSWCYNQCNYGRLYDWKTAVAACPPGWHLPSNEEWDILITAAGGKDIAGGKLKSKSGWNDYQGKSGNGTDDYGFSALPGGHLTSNYYLYGYRSDWWTSGYKYELFGGPINFGMYYDSDYVDSADNSSDFGFSARCVQD